MVPKICSIEGCDTEQSAKSLCSKHYHRIRRTGRAQRPTVEERLWAKVDKSGECWEWLGTKTPEGYGHISHNKKKVGTHRLSYELTVGPIPPSSVIDHMCHNPSCVRPDHLQAVTNKQNAENLLGAQRTSVSGVRGVSWNDKRQKWCAAVGSNGKSHNAGRYATLAEAEAAAIAKRNELFTNNLQDRNK